jgi:hypothetical protein
MNTNTHAHTHTQSQAAACPAAQSAPSLSQLQPGPDVSNHPPTCTLTPPRTGAANAQQRPHCASRLLPACLPLLILLLHLLSHTYTTQLHSGLHITCCLPHPGASLPTHTHPPNPAASPQQLLCCCVCPTCFSSPAGPAAAEPVQPQAAKSLSHPANRSPTSTRPPTPPTMWRPHLSAPALPCARVNLPQITRR